MPPDPPVRRPVSRGMRLGVDIVLATWEGRIGASLFLLFLLVSIAGPALLGPAPMQVHYLPGGAVARLLSPHEFAPLGTDFYGRSVLAQLVLGARSAFIISIVSTLF